MRNRNTCLACHKEKVDLGDKYHGLCFNCYRSLNTWILNKCEEYAYTKIRTGLVLIIALTIGEWLKEAESEV